MPPDHVCFVSLPAYGFFNPEAYERTGGGGAKRQLYLLSQELKADFDVHFVVGDYGQPKTETRDGVTLHRAYTPNQGNPASQFCALFAAMRRANANTYIYRGNPRKAAFTYAIAELLRRPLVYNLANDADLADHYEREHPVVRALFRRALRKAPAIIAQTDQQQWRLKERFGVSSIVVPNGYPLAETDPPETREFVLWVGRVEPAQNRPELFLDVAETLPDVECKLVGVAEDEDCRKEVENRCLNSKNVEFVGAVEPDEIHEYYRRAIALVNTSAYEGFPNTFLEAWRQATPVVSLDVDPGRYLKAGLYTGYAAGDFETFREELAALAENPDRRQRVGEELAAFFRENYAMTTIADQYGSVLR